MDLAGDAEDAAGLCVAGEDADGFIDFGDFVEEAEDVFDDAAEAGFGEQDAWRQGGELKDERTFVVQGEAFGDVEDDGVESGRLWGGDSGSGAEGGVVEGGVVEQPTGLADHGADFSALVADGVVLAVEGHFEVVGDGLDATEGLADFVEEPGEDIRLGGRREAWEEAGMGMGGQRCPV